MTRWGSSDPLTGVACRAGLFVAAWSYSAYSYVHFRSSSVFGVIERLRNAGVEVVVYEPGVTGEMIAGCEVVRDLGEFKQRCDVIVANRRAEELDDVAAKVYTRDIYGRD